MDNRDLEKGMEEMMYDAFMKVTNNKLKQEIARHLSRKISRSIDYETEFISWSPTSMAKDMSREIKGEHFIDGMNPLREGEEK